MIEKLFLVAIGGACGAMLRFVSVSTFGRLMGDVAWGTFFVNVVGSLVMGLSVAILIERFPDSAERFIPLVTIGLLADIPSQSDSLVRFQCFTSGIFGPLENRLVHLSIPLVFVCCAVVFFGIGHADGAGRVLQHIHTHIHRHTYLHTHMHHAGHGRGWLLSLIHI